MPTLNSPEFEVSIHLPHHYVDPCEGLSMKPRSLNSLLSVMAFLAAAAVCSAQDDDLAKGVGVRPNAVFEPLRT